MALQVWLPLTKDLRNQGLASITSSGTPVYKNNGRLSNKSLDLNTRISFNCPAMTNKSTFSVAFWAKVNADTSLTTNWVDVIGFTDQTSGGSNGQLRWETCYASGYETRGISSHDNATNATSNSFGSMIGTTKGVWYHIACTVDISNNIINEYRNGEIVHTIVPNGGHLTGTFWIGETGKINGEIQDVRIYDHALSQIEVKKLAQGLVLHYPLNKNSTYTSLIDKTANYNIYNNYGVTASLTATGEMYLGSPVRRLSMTPDSSHLSNFQTSLANHGVYNWRKTFTASTKYVFWIYYKPVSHMDVRVGGTASNISGWTEIPPKAVGDGWYVVGQYRNGSVAEDKTDNIFVSFYSPTATTGTPIQIDFACPTLIQGLTEIQPSINWNTGNIVYDNSGFCNNGEISGTWDSMSDAPKYTTSNHISTTSSKIHISNFPTSGFSNSYSFAWWGKRSDNGPMFWGFSDGVRLNGMYTGRLWNTGDSSNNPLYNIGTTTQVTAPSTNTWHHYVMTGNGTKCYVYLDGELWAEAKTYKAISGTSIWINGWDSGTSYCHTNCNMSDFRIYATALSASDVLSLYQNNAYIDSNNIIHGKIRD